MKRKQKKSIASNLPAADPALQAAEYRGLLSSAEYDMLLAEIDQPLPPAIRVNPLKTDPSFVQTLSAKYGWQLEPVPFCPTGYRVRNAPAAAISAALEHNLGLYYIQEVASMLPVELFTALNPGELILDMAASPGGKTTHLISRSADTTFVLANDSSQGRIQALRSVLQNWGAVNYAVTRFPAERFGEWFPDTFDKVLLDAPCSMQGLRTAESHPSRPVTAKESAQLSRRQRAMLTSAIRALRVGGEVVYSTCTLLPAEDEMVVDAILHDFSSLIEITDAQRILPVPAPGLTHYQDLAFSPDLKNSIRLWPHRYQTAGFFACHLRKLDETPGPTSEPPARPLEAVQFHVFSPREERAFCQLFTDTYGFDLAVELAAHHRTLVRHYEQVFIFPRHLLERFTTLPVQAAGMLLGEDTPGGFLPSQAWVSRYGSRCSSGVLRLTENESAEWIKGNNLESLDAPHMPDQKFIIVLDHEGHALGRAARAESGLKNLLRRRLA
jgi:16S rRNA (cytosine1407-C5)-methyltransferase